MQKAPHGVICTPVDGDQPSLLIDLVTWAEVLGMDIIAAGKSSEYDFVFDPASGNVTCAPSDTSTMAALYSVSRFIRMTG